MIFILVILAIILYYFHKPLQEIIRNISFKKAKKQDIKSLKSHDIFNTLERVKLEIGYMKFYTDGKYDATKSRMCSDFVKFKCSVCKDRFHDFLENDFTKINSDELKTLILSEMWGMHLEYVKQVKEFWYDKGIEQEDINYVIELFEKFRYDVIVSFQNRIDGIFGSSYHVTNYDKILATYEMYSMGIDLLPKDMLTTFEALNGKFAKIKYK